MMGMCESTNPSKSAEISFPFSLYKLGCEKQILITLERTLKASTFYQKSYLVWVHGKITQQKDNLLHFNI